MVPHVGRRTAGVPAGPYRSVDGNRDGHLGRPIQWIREWWSTIQPHVRHLDAAIRPECAFGPVETYRRLDRNGDDRMGRRVRRLFPCADVLGWEIRSRHGHLG